jgi:hypothetical protein
VRRDLLDEHALLLFKLQLELLKGSDEVELERLAGLGLAEVERPFLLVGLHRRLSSCR